ncbi:MAG: cohesin domain-containing protein, partial [Candidatus Promineifilaceae bacterium]
SSSQTISARWEISGPCGFTDGWSGSLAADPGSKDWRLESTLPPDACAGTYNYQVSVTYGGVTSSAATTFVVNSAATVTVTPLPPTATATSTGTAVPPTATPVTPTSQPPTPTSPPPPTGARVETGHYTVRPNEQVDADITAIDLPSPGVGAATVDIKYDPTILNPVACEVDPDGRFNGSACNISFGDDIVRFSLTSSSGEAGSVNLATITFEAVGNDGETSPLEVMLTTWADTSGSDITSATVDGSVTLQDGVLGDVNCNGTRNVIDSLFVLQYTVGSRTGNDDCSLASNEIYMPLCDTNEDTNCNVIDALFIIQCEVGNSNVLCPSSRTVPATREQTGESAITVGSDAMASGTEVVIPVSANVPLNASFSAATVDIIYDHTVINAVTCNTNSDFVGSCHLTQNQAGDHVARFSVASATSRSGALDLVEITFNSSEGNTANSSDLIASVEMFVDDQGNPLPYTAENGRIDVSSVESSVSTSEYGIQKSSYNGAIAAGILMLLMGTAVMVQRRGR